MICSADDDPHCTYTVDSLGKQFILLEEHFKSYQCPECMNKHLLAIEGYAEEGIPMVGDPQVFDAARAWAISVRELMLDGSKKMDFRRLTIGAREIRIRLVGGSHDRQHPDNPGPRSREVKLESCISQVEIKNDELGCSSKQIENQKGGCVNKFAVCEASIPQ